jgi:hypothetical protein
MSMLNDWIWRLIVESFWFRYGRDVKIIGAGAVGLLLLSGYLSARRRRQRRIGLEPTISGDG